MPEKRRLPQTFPHRVIFVASLTLCFCALGGVLLAALGWNHRVWGYYISTGFWSGGVVLLAGIFGIVASYVRNALSVKTFLILAIFGLLVSLAMIALSCGGLDPDSNFYEGRPTNTVLYYICHGVYLGLGCLQTAICILSDAICVYYLFVERHAEIYSIKLRGKGKPLKRSRPKSKDSTRASTASTAPLVSSGSTRSKVDSRNSKKRKTNEVYVAEDDECDMPIVRDRGSFIKSQNGFDMTTPIRTPCIRPASFTTFGHHQGPERASLIVHPDDSMSVPETNRSYFSDTDSSHYAHTSLFGPPIPIEEDEELPPYIHEQHSPEYMQEVPNVQYRSSFQMRRPNSSQIQQINRRNYMQPSSQVMPNNTAVIVPVPVQPQNNPENTPNAFSKYIIDRPELSSQLSQSEDTLNGNIVKSGIIPEHHEQTQGVQVRDFSSSLSDSDKAIRDFRSHSVRNFKDPRLNRQRRARSVELKPIKGQYVIAESGYDDRDMVHPAYDSTSALYAKTKTLPTKFCVRNRMSDGDVKSRVIVRSLSSLPIFSPPTKPPRTHSVTLEDLLETIDNLPEGSAKELSQPSDKKRKSEHSVVKQKEVRDMQPIKAELMKDLNKRLSQKKKTHDYATLAEMKEMKSSESEIKLDVIVPVASMPKETVVTNNQSNLPPVNITQVRHVNKIVQPVQPVQTEEDDVFLPPPPPSKVETTTRENKSVLPSKFETKETNNNTIFTQKVKQKEEKKEDSKTSSVSDITIDSGPVVKVSLPVKPTSETVKVQHTKTETVDVPKRNESTSKPTSATSEVMALPTSPIIIQPPITKRTNSQVGEPVKKSIEPGNKQAFSYPEIVTVDLRNKTVQAQSTSPNYAKLDKKAPAVKPKPQMYRLSTDRANVIDKNVSRNTGNRAQSMDMSKSAHVPGGKANHPNRASDSSVVPRLWSAPMTASDRILQKKEERPVINAQGVNPSTSSYPSKNLFMPSDEHSGARPKTSSYRRSSSEDPDERPIRPLVRDDPKRPASIHTSKASQDHSPALLPQPYHSKPKFSFAYPTSPTSPVSPTRSPPSTTESKPSYTENKAQQDNRNSVKVTQSVPVGNGSVIITLPKTNEHLRTTNTTVAPTPTVSRSAESPSQGVLHLPQSQYQRQVDGDQGAGPSGAMAHPQPHPVPIQEQDDDPDGEKPLFSVVL